MLELQRGLLVAKGGGGRVDGLGGVPLAMAKGRRRMRRRRGQADCGGIVGLVWFIVQAW